jgi:hypothetical protein
MGATRRGTLCQDGRNPLAAGGEGVAQFEAPTCTVSPILTGQSPSATRATASSRDATGGCRLGVRGTVWVGKGKYRSANGRNVEEYKYNVLWISGAANGAGGGVRRPQGGLALPAGWPPPEGAGQSLRPPAAGGCRSPSAGRWMRACGTRPARRTAPPGAHPQAAPRAIATRWPSAPDGRQGARLLQARPARIRRAGNNRLGFGGTSSSRKVVAICTTERRRSIRMRAFLAGCLVHVAGWVPLHTLPAADSTPCSQINSAEQPPLAKLLAPASRLVSQSKVALGRIMPCLTRRPRSPVETLHFVSTRRSLPAEAGLLSACDWCPCCSSGKDSCSPPLLSAPDVARHRVLLRLDCASLAHRWHPPPPSRWRRVPAVHPLQLPCSRSGCAILHGGRAALLAPPCKAAALKAPSDRAG